MISNDEVEASDIESSSSLSVPSDLGSVHSSAFGDVSEDDEKSLRSEEDEDGVEGDVDDDSVSRKIRRKRGSGKKRFLRHKKGQRSQSVSPSSVLGKDYGKEVDAVLQSALSDEDEEEDCDKSICPSSAPSEGERTVFEDAEEEDGETLEQVLSTTTRRRTKRIGRKRKFFWKKNDSSVGTQPMQDADTSEDERVGPQEEQKCSNVRSSEVDGSSNAQPMQVADTSEDERVGPQEEQKCSNVRSSKVDGSSTESLSLVTQYLMMTLDDTWIVSFANGIISLTKLRNSVNPYVERCITWDGRKINFLVHNQTVNPNSRLWKMERPDSGNLGGVADYLTRCSKAFSFFEICGGIDSHQHLWKKFTEVSYKDLLSGSAVIRSAKCSLLQVYPGKCNNCHSLLRKMFDHDRHKLKKARTGKHDIAKVNYTYLSKEDLVERIKKVQKEKKLSKQTEKRLRERISKLLQKNSERIDSELGEDFINIMNQNTDKMTAVEKLFWEQQSKAISKKGAERTMRWHPAMIRLALQFRMISPAAYDFMQGVLHLPSKRRLFDYSQFTDVKEGVQQDLLEFLYQQIQDQCPADNLKFFNLLLDEMSIRSDLVFNSRSGELVGFTNLLSLEDTLASLDAEIQGKSYEKKLAKKILVFLLNGAVNDVQFVAAVYATDDLSAGQLFARAWEVIYFVEEAEAKVLAIVFDGASVNRKFINMHGNANTTGSIYRSENSAAGEARQLFFVVDPPHLIKTFRNCLANSYCHRQSRTLCLNEQDLSWKAIEALFNILQSQKYQDTKLTGSHVHLTSFSCMKVSLAVQVLSKSVSRALLKFKDVPPLKDYYSSELVRFIDIMNKWFDCLNGSVESQKKLENPDLREYTSVSDPRLMWLRNDFLQYLEEWEDFVQKRVGRFSKDQRSRMIISHQSLEAIKITTRAFVEITEFLLKAGVPSVSARKFNQDPLEQFFSDLRRARGSDNNPTVKQALHSRLAFQSVGKMTAGGKRGNTEDLRQMEVDSSPLPVRKKSKK